jgi:hypothetical protein
LTISLDGIRRCFNNSQTFNIFHYIWDISMKFYHLLMMASALRWWSRFYGLTHKNIDLHQPAICATLREKRVMLHKEFHISDIFLQFPKRKIEVLMLFFFSDKLSPHFPTSLWRNVLFRIERRLWVLMIRFDKFVIRVLLLYLNHLLSCLLIYNNW